MDANLPNSPSPLRHALFWGENELSIDEKNRLLIPATTRKEIDPQRDGEAVFVVIGVNRKPWLYCERLYELLVSQDAMEMTPEEDLLAFDQMNFALAEKVPIDKQGRVLLPEKVLKRTATPREITLIGVRDHLEIWPRDAWEAHFEVLMQKPSDVAQRAKKIRRAMQLPPVSP